jgi:hypothetical protein
MKIPSSHLHCPSTHCVSPTTPSPY